MRLKEDMKSLPDLYCFFPVFFVIFQTDYQAENLIYGKVKGAPPPPPTSDGGHLAWLGLGISNLLGRVWLSRSYKYSALHLIGSGIVESALHYNQILLVLLYLNSTQN